MNHLGRHPQANSGIDAVQRDYETVRHSAELSRTRPPPVQKWRARGNRRADSARPQPASIDILDTVSRPLKRSLPPLDDQLVCARIERDSGEEMKGKQSIAGRATRPIAGDDHRALIAEGDGANTELFDEDACCRSRT
jgi:hypothetical protein